MAKKQITQKKTKGKARHVKTIRCPECNRFGQKAHPEHWCRICETKAEEKAAPGMEKGKLPEAMQKPIEELRGATGLEVGREAPVDQPDEGPLKRRYREGVDDNPLRSSLSNAHVSVGSTSAERLARKAHWMQQAEKHQLMAESQSRCTFDDVGRAFFKGAPVMLSHKEDRAARKREMKNRLKVRSERLKAADAQARGMGPLAGPTGSRETKVQKPGSNELFAEVVSTNIVDEQAPLKHGAIAGE